MSDIRRDNDKSLNLNSNSNHRNSKDDNEDYHRKRTNDHSNSQTTTNIDAKVYVGNIPTENLTDKELLDFFKPFGKVSDIRVYKGYLFVQYDRSDDARKLIKQGQTSLILKGNKLDVLPAMEASSTTTKSSSTETSYKDRKSSERQSSKNSRRYSDHDRNYQPPRKRYTSKHHTDENRSTSIINNTNDSIVMEIDNNISSSRCFTRRLSQSPNTHSFDNHQSFYQILTGPDDPRQLVDCQIIIVNPRQRGYGEEISSYLRSHGLVTSIVLLREDYTLTEAIENASRQQCFYGIIAMPMHEERHTASFHILYGQTEEHRNLTLEDGYHIILTNFNGYKQRIRNEQIDFQQRYNNQSIVYPQSSEYIHQSNKISQEQIIPPTLTINDKLPLSMLLCLLADGRQLTLEEIDRVLVYLLEKKCKMLTLPNGTLPPLPVQYATNKALDHQTGSGILSDPKSNSKRIDGSSSKCSSSSELSATIAEQIRQILSTNLIKPSNSTEEGTINNWFEPSSNMIKVEDPNISQSKNKINEVTKEYVDYQQQQQQVESQSHDIISDQHSFSYTKSNVTPSFQYPSPNGTPTPFAAPTFSSYDSVNQSFRQNSPLKQTTPVTVSNFVCQPSQYLYPVPPPPSLTPLTTQNLYQSLSNSAAADAAAAIFQAYSQFNARPTPIASQQHQQIRK